MKTPDPNNRLSRRHFLKKSSLITALGLTGAVPIPRKEPVVRPRSERRAGLETVNFALIGFGQWGREIAATLGRLPEANLAAVSDTYDVMLTRAERSVPDVTTHLDYREVLDNPDIHAVIIATPTHLHRQIAIDALAAGKHVYCEAPMAASIEDARAIAQAARDATDQIFQVGLQYRNDPQYQSLFGFIRSGVLGQPTMTRGQWHAKESWRRTSPNREFERASNWRLDPDVSIGLIGEVGVHQLDTMFWFLQERPTAVTGFGQIRLWDDGRVIPDTIQTIIEFPSGVNMMYDATLASSFDSMYDMLYGSNSTIMIRDSKAWMFKEVDAPMLGWEVYARKDSFYKEKGIALVANATKLEAQTQDPTADDPNIESPLWYALNAFMDNYAYGPFPPPAGYEQGYESAVVAIKAHEAIMNNTKLEFDPALFELS